MQCKEIIEVLEKVAPSCYALEWDNVGLLVGRKDKEVERILIALDATKDVIDKCIDEHIDLLITHHPLIFRGVKQVSDSDFIQRRILDLARNDTAYYAMHTNFDVSKMGELVADLLGIKDRRVLDITYSDVFTSRIEGCGRHGKLGSIYSLKEYAHQVKEQLYIDNVIVYGQLDSLIESVAVLPGSGADCIGKALDLGVDLYITGDIKYHDAIDAMEQGLSIIDVGHYGGEKIFIPYMASYLKMELSKVDIMTYKKEPLICIL